MVSSNSNDRQADHRPSYQLLKELGDSYAAAEEFDKAKDCYQKASAMGGGDSGAYVGLGAIAIRENRLDDAAGSFRTAVALDPKCSEAYSGLAMVHQAKQEFHLAQEMYLKCLELDGDNLLSLLGLFQTSCRMHTFAKIIYYLEVYLNLHPDDASVLFCLGSLYAREGQLARSRAALERVLTLEPGKADAQQLLTQVRRDLAGGPSQQLVAG